MDAVALASAEALRRAPLEVFFDAKRLLNLFIAFIWQCLSQQTALKRGWAKAELTT
jgi:hypothetical protein